MRNVKLEQATAEDSDFLYRLHKAALGDYVEKTWGWDESFQRAYFDRYFDPSVRKIICWDSNPVGCIAYRVQADAIVLDYIALLPEYQRRGIGTFLVDQVIAEADRVGLPVCLTVLRVNPARHLYERLGFVSTGGDAQRHYMERSAAHD